MEEFLRAIDVDKPNNQYARYRVLPADQDLSLAKLCLTYLEFDDFGGEVWSGKEDFDACIDEYPLFDYACTIWFYHARNFHDGETLLELIQILFDPSKTSNFLHWSHYWTWILSSDDTITLTSGTATLHFAAKLALYNTCKWIVVEKGRIGDIDKITNIGSPLYCAIAGQNLFQNVRSLRNRSPIIPGLGNRTSGINNRKRT
jgi:hypothetical protein